MKPLELKLQGAGACSAAGDLAASIGALDPQAAALGPQLLDAFDCCGDAVAALPAAVCEALPLAFMPRAQALLAAAAQDLSQRCGVALAQLGAERLFIIAPESAPQGPAELKQAWLNLQPPMSAHALSRQAQRISVHAEVAEGLAAAAVFLGAAGSQAHALVLACESWLSHDALARLDDIDELRSASSDGVLPGEAAVLLRLGSAGLPLRCLAPVETEARSGNARPLGTAISEAVLQLQVAEDARFIVRDLHAGQRAFVREAEFLRRRHWPALAPDAHAWRDVSALGYLGRAAPLLQMALLAELPPAQTPALAYARSLWRGSLVLHRASSHVRAA